MINLRGRTADPEKELEDRRRMAFHKTRYRAERSIERIMIQCSKILLENVSIKVVVQVHSFMKVSEMARWLPILCWYMMDKQEERTEGRGSLGEGRRAGLGKIALFRDNGNILSFSECYFSLNM